MGKTSYPVYPRSEFLLWSRTHAVNFVQSAAQIGLTNEAAEQYQAEVAAVDQLLNEQETLLNAYRTKTSEVEAALTRLLTSTGNTVRTIRAFAATAPDPQAVFSAARLDPPRKATPAAAPAQPQSLAARLISGDGALEISWKARNPRGTQGTAYIVRRRLAGEREFSFLGVTGAKRFTDNTVPAGVTGVEYTVQGQRADVSGAWSPILSVALGSVRAAVGEARRPLAA